MQIKFWGVRGSLPTPQTPTQIREKMQRLLEQASRENISTPEKREQLLDKDPVFSTGTVGGNTSCVQVTAGSTLLVFDMGSGLKQLGNYLMQQPQAKEGYDINIFLSHTHWDHIMGLPFFTPAYLPQTRLIFHSPHPNFEERLRMQQDYRFFPVALEEMPSEKQFVQLSEEEEITIGDLTVNTVRFHHPGNSYAYRVTWQNKVFVYSTDTEYKDLSQTATERYSNFFQDADVITFDAQYTLLEALHHKEDWGHSTAIIGVDLCAEAGVKNLVLYHHEPENDDLAIKTILEEAQHYKTINYPDSPLEIYAGYEGLEFTL